MITGVNISGITRYLQTAPNPTIIWDRIAIILEVDDVHYKIGTNAPITWTGVYEYDESLFPGTITLNDTVRKDVPGTYHYTVQAISEDTYGIPGFEANTVSVVFVEVGTTGVGIPEFIPGGTVGIVAGISIGIGVILRRQRR